MSLNQWWFIVPSFSICVHDCAHSSPLRTFLLSVNQLTVWSQQNSLCGAVRREQQLEKCAEQEINT